MMWEVEGTNEFVDWYSTLSEEDQDEMTARVEVVEAGVPGLGRPIVDQVHQSRHAHMKELREEGLF